MQTIFFYTTGNYIAFKLGFINYKSHNKEQNKEITCSMKKADIEFILFVIPCLLILKAPGINLLLFYLELTISVHMTKKG